MRFLDLYLVICTPVFLSFHDLYLGFDFMFIPLYEIRSRKLRKTWVQIKSQVQIKKTEKNRGTDHPA